MQDYTKLKEYASTNYNSKDTSCAEAVLRALLDFYSIEHTEKDIHLAAAFGGGVGYSGCICGAISGALIAFSYILDLERIDVNKFNLSEEDKKKWNNAPASKYLASILYEKFKQEHHVTCCKIITHKHSGKPKERKEFCTFLTEEVSMWSAQIIDNYNATKA